MKLMVLNNASKQQQQQSSGKAAGGEAPAATAASSTAKAETTAGAEVRKRFEFVLFCLSIIYLIIILPTLNYLYLPSLPPKVNGKIGEAAKS